MPYDSFCNGKTIRAQELFLQMMKIFLWRVENDHAGDGAGCGVALACPAPIGPVGLELLKHFSVCWPAVPGPGVGVYADGAGAEGVAVVGYDPAGGKGADLDGDGLGRWWEDLRLRLRWGGAAGQED